VILFALLAGYLPFSDPSMRRLMEKIKAGRFEMPALDGDATALLAAMLSVDPGARPTASQIKASPLFLRGLRADYRVPAPLPLAGDAAPLDPAAVPPEVLALVRQIGFADEAELQADLAAPGRSMAKVFVAMLTAQIDLEALPWEAAHGAPPDAGVLCTASFMDARPPMRTAGQPASLKVRSVASRHEWCVSAEPRGAIAEEERPVDGLPIWDVMACVQRAVGEAGMQFFHPDPVTIYARGAGISATVRAQIVAEENVVVVAVLHKGYVERFGALAGRMWELLKQEADAESWLFC
jgi:BR serine/threonine kinase